MHTTHRIDPELSVVVAGMLDLHWTMKRWMEFNCPSFLIVIFIRRTCSQGCFIPLKTACKSDAWREHFCLFFKIWPRTSFAPVFWLLWIRDSSYFIIMHLKLAISRCFAFLKLMLYCVCLGIHSSFKWWLAKADGGWPFRICTNATLFKSIWFHHNRGILADPYAAFLTTGSPFQWQLHVIYNI